MQGFAVLIDQWNIRVELGVQICEGMPGAKQHQAISEQKTDGDCFAESDVDSCITHNKTSYFTFPAALVRLCKSGVVDMMNNTDY
jgi:hypothetical protein